MQQKHISANHPPREACLGLPQKRPEHYRPSGRKIGGATVVLDGDAYIQKADQQRSTGTTYSPLQCDPNAKHVMHISKTMSTTKTGSGGGGGPKGYFFRNLGVVQPGGGRGRL